MKLNKNQETDRHWNCNCSNDTCGNDCIFVPVPYRFFSQEYRTIDGYEEIVFKDSRSGQCYRLCIWGLAITENISGFEDHRDPDTSSYEYQLLTEKANAEGIWQMLITVFFICVGIVNFFRSKMHNKFPIIF